MVVGLHIVLKNNNVSIFLGLGFFSLNSKTRKKIKIMYDVHLIFFPLTIIYVIYFFKGKISN